MLPQICSASRFRVTYVNKTRLQVAFASEPSRNPNCSHTFDFNFDGASFSVVEEAILPADVMLSMLFIHSLDAILAIDQ